MASQLLITKLPGNLIEINLINVYNTDITKNQYGSVKTKTFINDDKMPTELTDKLKANKNINKN